MPNKVKSRTGVNQRSIPVRDANISTDRQTLVWSFEKTDRNDQFRFTSDRDDMEHHELLYHIMQYSDRTWAEIKQDTHDRNNKSKHHTLSYDSLSRCAQQRMLAMNIEDDVFSLALTNRLRIIGIRDGRIFRAIWYDPNHEFCPVEY